MKDNRTALNNAIQWEDFGMPYSSSQGVADNRTALHTAINERHLDMVKNLLHRKL